jgi:S-adenosylmethionine-diacylglycerol 3-amino-3-carboxypropyl transferase
MEALASFASWPRDISRTAPKPADRVLYGQVWEDADILVEALDVRPGHVCLSIASAGDNVLALAAQRPSQIIAIDRDTAQLCCLELRIATYRVLDHEGLLELIGSRPSRRRRELYERCRGAMSPAARRFWDVRPEAIARGIGSAGRFERYFAAFRTWVLPLVHSKETVARLLTGVSVEERERFYDEVWNTWRWRLLFRAFFSRAVMGRLGRERECFAHVNGDIAAPILERTRRALTVLNPADNPYVHWILTGHHGDALPYALRPENFDAIRGALDRVHYRHQSLGEFVRSCARPRLDRCNLSDVFEYMSLDEYHTLLERLIHVCRDEARLVYWNVFAERTRPASLDTMLKPARALATSLHSSDRAFFYSRLVIEDVIQCP